MSSSKEITRESLNHRTLFLTPIISSLVAISKVNAEVCLVRAPVNLFNGADFFKKLSLIARVLPLFILTTFFRVGSGMIKHSGPYPKVAEPYSTLFFFLTIRFGVLVYTILYLCAFSGAKQGI